MNRIAKIIKIAKLLEINPTPDQLRFNQEGLEKIKKHIGTIDIDVISEKDDPEKYNKYFELYKNHPAEGFRNRMPSVCTGIYSFKKIGGRGIIHWRDATINDHFLIAPKGLFNILNPKKDSSLNIVASINWRKLK
jgi:hypothetical protein